MFYVSADTKSFAPVMSAINGAIEVAELANDLGHFSVGSKDSSQSLF